MEFWIRLLDRLTLLMAVICLCLTTGSATGSQPPRVQAGQEPPAQAASISRPVGTIKSISGNTILLTSDAGGDVTVQVQEATRLVRISPGQKDLKDATPIQSADLQPGDRILVRGKLGDDGKSVVASSIIAMKKTDIADKQSREREEWQRHGFGGLVNSIDSATSTIHVALPSPGENKTVAIHISKNTVLRRYASDSVKFDDAKPAPLDQIKPGDQLRARGTRSADSAEFTADEIVSGTFRNIAGTVSSLNASAGTITIEDLVARKPTTVRVTSESQLRTLPPPVALRIAARLRRTPAETPSTAATRPNGPASAGPGSGGAGRSGGGGGSADLQQLISRLPAATLADLQKGAAVMVVATEGGASGVPTVITLLGGVEPILEASPNSSPSTILSPWSLTTGGGEAAAP